MAKLFTDKGRFFVLLFFVLVVTYLFSNFIGLARGGFEASEILNLQTFYLTGAAFAIVLIAGYLYETSSKVGDREYGNSIGFASLGEKPHLRFFERFTKPQITFACIILFTILALANISLVQQGYGQTSYTGVGFLEAEQFTPTDSIIYSSSLIPGAENLGGAAFIAVLMITFGILIRTGKIKVSPGTQTIIIILIIILGLALFGFGNHLLRYRGSEVALQTVILFWGIGGALTAITGSFIPFWILHIVNNLFFDLSRFYSNESIFLITIVFIVAMIVIYAIAYSGRLLGSEERMKAR